MTRRIEEDHKEFRDIIKDKVKSKLKDFIKSGKRVVRRGDKYIEVDIPVIEIPTFRYGNPFEDGIGNGEVGVGDEVGEGPSPQGDGDGSGNQGRGGNGEGEHTVSVGVDMDSYIELVGEELKLPKLTPKANAKNMVEKIKYNRISNSGNNSLLHKKRTFKNALKRVISTSNYDHRNLDNVYPIREDKQYKSWSVIQNPDVNAVIFFMADISASMTADKRELIQQLCWYLEMWIKKFYNETQIKYIVHDWTAQEVDQEKFYGYSSGGGTKISSAFELAHDTIKSSYPLDQWNVYCFYLSDGEVNGDSDLNQSFNVISELQKMCNIIGVTDVKAMGMWSQFLPFIKSKIESGELDKNTVIPTSINTYDDVLTALKTMLQMQNENA